MNVFTLSEREQESLAKFLAIPRVKKLLNQGGAWALVVGPSTGIGNPLTVHVRNSDFTAFIKKDITDYASW